MYLNVAENRTAAGPEFSGHVRNFGIKICVRK